MLVLLPILRAFKRYITCLDTSPPTPSPSTDPSSPFTALMHGFEFPAKMAWRKSRRFAFDDPLISVLTPSPTSLKLHSYQQNGVGIIFIETVKIPRIKSLQQTNLYKKQPLLAWSHIVSLSFHVTFGPIATKTREEMWIKQTLRNV